MPPAVPPLEPPEPPDELNFGAGPELPEPPDELPPPEDGVPAGLYVLPEGALDGAAGTVNGLFGAVAILGARAGAVPAGLTEGFAALGALTGDGLAGAGALATFG